MPVKAIIRAAGRTAASAGAPALCPWPTDAAARAMAIERLRDAIGGRAYGSDEAAAALGEAAAARVARYAPGAPQAIRDEACIRLAGYLAGSDYGGIVSETSVESATVSYSVNHSDAFRRSGAAGLLSPWRIRRAGAIG